MVLFLGLLLFLHCYLATSCDLLFSPLSFEQVLDMYPQLAGKVEYFELGSPLSNNYYLGSCSGEIYGLDHDITRMRWDVQMKLRPDIGVPGLYVTGQVSGRLLL